MTLPPGEARGGLLYCSVDALEARSSDSKAEASKRPGVAAECGLCLDEFLDSGKRVPRNLLCGHTFCTDCISKLIFYKANSRPEIDCPKCHDITPVPDNDVCKLPKNFGLIEVISSSVPANSHAALVNPPQISNDDVMDASHPVCQVHKDHISGYCLQDDVLVCSSCQLYGAHKGHNCLLVPEAADQLRAKLCQLNPEVEKQKKQMHVLLKQVEDNLQKVEKNGGSVLDSVDSQFALLTAALDKRRKELRMKVLERTQVRVHALMTQAADLRDTIDRAASAYSQAASLLFSNDFTLLQGSSLALDKVEAVFTNPPATLPSAEPDLTVEFSQGVFSDMTSHLEEFGAVKSVAGSVKSITVNEYHDGFRVFWDRHNLADNEGICYHLQGLVGEYQEDQNDYVILYRGGNTKFTWKTELKKHVPYKFRVQVRTTEGVGNWSDPITAFRAEPELRWHDSRRNVRVDLSADKLVASISRGSSGGNWATLAGDRLFESGQLYVELNILDVGKSRSGKEKVVLGVIQCSPSTVNSVLWAECLGKMESSPSFAYYPSAGTKNCHLFPDGKCYTSSIQLEVGDKLGMLLDMDKGNLHFFHNGTDMGMAFDALHSEYLLPAVSIRDKVRVRLCFPPPPFSQRDPKIVRLSSFGVASQRYHKNK